MKEHFVVRRVRELANKPLRLAVCIILVVELKRTALRQNVAEQVRPAQRGVSANQATQTVAANYGSRSHSPERVLTLNPRQKVFCEKRHEGIVERHVKRAGFPTVIDEDGDRLLDLVCGV